MNKFVNVLKLCFAGVFDLLQDAAGTFALIVLFGLIIVTYLRPQLGGIALAAFATSAPACLAYVNHRVTLAQLASQVSPASNNLPPGGQL